MNPHLFSNLFFARHSKDPGIPIKRLFELPLQKKAPSAHFPGNRLASALFFIAAYLLVSLQNISLQAHVTQEWTRQFNNTMASGYDTPEAVTTDAMGNVIVTGASSLTDVSGWDYTTVKYTPEGTQLWVKNYKGAAGKQDVATALTTDPEGNIYVTGYSFTDFNAGNDFVTIKYDPLGNELWLRRYNSPRNTNDEPKAINIDTQGNIYVGGSTRNGAAYIVVKYNAQGLRLQVIDFEVGTSGIKTVKAIALDAQGNLYLTGTDSQSENDNYMTAKYNAAGNRLWVNTYSYSSDSDDEPVDMAVDGQGNVYVTGFSSSVPYPDYYYQYATVKYDIQGKQLWVRRYSQGDKTYNFAQAMAIDQAGHIYVSGYSNFPENGGQSNPTIKYDPQGNQVWVRSIGNGANFTVGASGNLYFAGTAFVSLAYDAAGKLLWQSDYNSAGNGEDYAVSLTLDKQGNVYVTGRVSQQVDESDSNFDIATVKYDARGNQKWVKTYKGPKNGDDHPVAVAVDLQGNIIVTGSSFGGSSKPYSFPSDNDYNYDLLTIKYSPEGAELWVKRYASPNEGVDIAAGMQPDGQGNIYVAGRDKILKYDSQGNQLWVTPLSNEASAGFLALDAQGNVYITGNDKPNYGLFSEKIITAKLSPQGAELWSRTFIKDEYSSASDIAVDKEGNVYVAGSNTNLNYYYDYETELVTLKYNTSGNLVWTRYENSDYSVDPFKAAQALALDQQGNVYVLGIAYGSKPLYFTHKYDPNGNRLWNKQYTGPDGTPGQAAEIVTDGIQGDVYVAGNQGIIKYSGRGDVLWTQPYNGTPVGITLDVQKNVYITGSITNGNFSSDYLTARYSQESGLIECTATGSVLQELWLNVVGSLVTDIPLATTPTSTARLTSFESKSNQGTNYGERIRGYLCVPTTGSYTFYIAGDDRCELYLSTDDDPAKKVKIASVPYFTAVRQWNKYASQKSVAIALQAGKKYYIEALHKEDKYSDNLAVGWQTSPSAPITVIPGSSLSPYVPGGEGKITREYWANVPGSLVTDIPLTTPATSVGELTVFETATNAGSNYGQRIRGYLHPQVSGNYRFFIAGDDRCELWLSTDEDPAKKTKIASVPYFTAVRQWNKYSSQQSALIALVAGRKYYIEALHKEGLYSDHLAVGWSLPGQTAIAVISGNYLSPYQAAEPLPVARKSAGQAAETPVFSVYPNPFNQKMIIHTSLSGSLHIGLSDNLGKVLYTLTKEAEGPQTELDVSGLQLKTGVYFLKVSSGSGKSTVFKLMKH